MPEATESAASAPAEEPVRTITREELRARLEAGAPLTLVEILPPPMYRAGHLPGAIYIAPVQVRELAPKRLPDKSAPIVVYCAGFT